MKTFRSAGGLVVGPDGRVLVVNQNRDSWSLPKGHLDPGENELQAARREIAEESGVTELRLAAPLGSYVRTRLARGGGEDKTQRKKLTFFLFHTGQKTLRPRDPRNPEARWVEPARVAALLTHPRDKAFFVRAWKKAARLPRSRTYFWKSPLGWLRLEAEGRTIHSVVFAKAPSKIEAPPSWISKALSRYFSGRPENFDALRRLPEGTPFQKSVWAQLARIPRGRTVSYAQLARRAGRPRAVRAAASAVGSNPLCLVLPCHRVIASDGGIGGYAYGPRIKRALLKLEGIRI